MTQHPEPYCHLHRRESDSLASRWSSERSAECRKPATSIFPQFFITIRAALPVGGNSLRPQPAHMEKTILVTGGAGFIGSNFMLQWFEQEASDRESRQADLCGQSANLVRVSSDPGYCFATAMSATENSSGN